MYLQLLQKEQFRKKKKKKTADETDDLIGNRNDNKVIGVSKTSQQNNPELVTKERNQDKKLLMI